MAYNTIHVNGPAILCAAKAGTTPVRFGVSDKGVNITITKNLSPVMADDAGQFIPADLQYEGFIANVSFRLTRWEESILERIRATLPDRTAGTVLPADIGTLVVTAGQYWELYIESSARTGLVAESPWRFPVAIPTDAFSVNVGTIHGTAPGGFTCYPNSSGVLYTRA